MNTRTYMIRCRPPDLEQLATGTATGALVTLCLWRRVQAFLTTTTTTYPSALLTRWQHPIIKKHLLISV